MSVRTRRSAYKRLHPGMKGRVLVPLPHGVPSSFEFSGIQFNKKPCVSWRRESPPLARPRICECGRVMVDLQMGLWCELQYVWFPGRVTSIPRPGLITIGGGGVLGLREPRAHSVAYLL